MIRAIQLILGSIVLSFILISCGSDSESSPSGPGISFIPNAVGNEWNYDYHRVDKGNDRLTLRILGNDTMTSNGTKYTVTKIGIFDSTCKDGEVIDWTTGEEYSYLLARDNNGYEMYYNVSKKDPLTYNFALYIPNSPKANISDNHTFLESTVYANEKVEWLENEDITIGDSVYKNCYHLSITSAPYKEYSMQKADFYICKDIGIVKYSLIRTIIETGVYLFKYEYKLNSYKLNN